MLDTIFSRKHFGLRTVRTIAIGLEKQISERRMDVCGDLRRRCIRDTHRRARWPQESHRHENTWRTRGEELSFTSECSSAHVTSSCRRFCAVCRLCFWRWASATTEKGGEGMNPETRKPQNSKLFSENTKDRRRMCWWGDGGDLVDSRWLEEREHRRCEYSTASYSEEQVWFWKSETHFWVWFVPDFRILSANKSVKLQQIMEKGFNFHPLFDIRLQGSYKHTHTHHVWIIYVHVNTMKNAKKPGLKDEAGGALNHCDITQTGWHQRWHDACFIAWSRLSGQTDGCSTFVSSLFTTHILFFKPWPSVLWVKTIK